VLDCANHPESYSLPVQLSVCIRLEMHVNTSHVLSNRQEVNILLSGPSSAILSMSVVREAQWPLSVRNIAGVGSLQMIWSDAIASNRYTQTYRRNIQIRVLLLQQLIPRSRIRRRFSSSTTNRLWVLDLTQIEVEACIRICSLQRTYAERIRRDNSGIVRADNIGRVNTEEFRSASQLS
jgi:hypothetical protein